MIWLGLGSTALALACAYDEKEFKSLSWKHYILIFLSGGIGLGVVLGLILKDIKKGMNQNGEGN